MSMGNAPNANGVSTPATTTSTTDPNLTITQPPSTVDTKAPSEVQPASSKQPSKKERPQPKPSTTEQNIQEAGHGVKLTGAQLKKQKAAEKAARRAEKVALKGEQAQVQADGGVTSTNRPSQQQQQQKQRQQQQPQPQSQPRRPSQGGPSQPGSNVLAATKHQRKPSNQGTEPGVIRIPFRPGAQPTSGPGAPPPQPQGAQALGPKQHEKKAPLVSHLYPSGRSASLTSAPRELHPSILTLALHTKSLVLAGSTARTTALLLCLKRVITSYTTPPSTALSRHLTTHLSHQLTFLSSARPLSIPQGNAIRWLKKLISQLDPDLDENDAKKFLCAAIDGFIREKVTLAGEVIAAQACGRIADAGETILVYGKSSVVERTLLTAAREHGKKFTVVVVDSRPLFEGKNLARSLLRAGMREGGALDGCHVVYALLTGLSDILVQYPVTKCVLGASAMLGNGCLYSRAGTAMVAMCMKAHRVPTMVLCESVKFTGKMAVDSLSLNEVGDVDGLIEVLDKAPVTVHVAKTDDPKPGGGGGGGGGAKKKRAEDETPAAEEDTRSKGLLSEWKDQQGLYLVNLMYDVTPTEFLDMVICELGTLPPGAVPVVRGDGGDE